MGWGRSAKKVVKQIYNVVIHPWPKIKTSFDIKEVHYKVQGNYKSIFTLDSDTFLLFIWEMLDNWMKLSNEVKAYLVVQIEIMKKLDMDFYLNTFFNFYYLSMCFCGICLLFTLFSIVFKFEKFKLTKWCLRMFYLILVWFYMVFSIAFMNNPKLYFLNMDFYHFVIAICMIFCFYIMIEIGVILFKVCLYKIYNSKLGIHYFWMFWLMILFFFILLIYIKFMVFLFRPVSLRLMWMTLEIPYARLLALFMLVFMFMFFW